jgi:iron-sulfur cluster assembly accessory protein
MTTHRLLRLTHNCVQHILTKCKQNEMLRVTVDAGGCNGFSYHYKCDDALAPDDTVVSHAGATVVVDAVSAPFLKGAVLDYSEELIRAGFVIDTNPNAEAACGCNTSFSIKN